MNKTTKIILIVIGSLLIVCMCAGVAIFATGAWSIGKVARWADTNTTRDLSDVAKLASEIAVFTIPDGYGSPYGMHIAEITSVGFASPSRNTHIILTQFPEGTSVNAEGMVKLMQQYAVDPNSRWNDANTTVVEEKPISIRGKESTLVISEGTSSDGTQYRSAMTTFQGNHGPALLMIAGPLDEWDNQMVEDFVASIQ